MTVTYHAGRRIQGLAYTAPNITKDEDFSDVWNGVGSNIAITDGELVATSVDASGDNRVYRDLGFTLADNFTARWEHTPKGVSSNSVFLPIMNFTAGTGNLSTSTNQDRIYLFTDNSSQVLIFRGQDGTTAGTNSNTQALTTDTKYYLELVKNGTSGTVYVREGSHSGTLVNTLTTTIASGITGLTHVQSGAMTGGNSGTGSYTVDNLEIWNNATSASGTATFTENFSSSDIWTTKGSMGVSGGTLTGANVLDGGDDTSYYDLTSTSDTNWILRFKGTYTTTYGTGGASKLLYVGLSSDTNAMNTAKDFAGFIFEQWNLPQFKISGGVVNNATLEYASSLSNLSALDTTSATTVTNYFEIKRDNDDFTFTVYSNSDYSTGQLATVTRTVSSVTTLRYLVLTNRDLSATNTGSLTVSVDDVEFYNDITTPIKTGIGDEKPTNVQVGSRFEETDTRKMYNYKESDTIESTATYQYTSMTGSQTITNGSYEISAQKILNSSSELVGERIGRIDVPMALASGTGTVTAGVFDSSGNTLHTFGTRDITTISTSRNPYNFYSFTGTSSYTLSVGEYVGVKIGSSGSLYIPHRDNTSQTGGNYYDGSNSHWDRWNGSWSGSFTNIDQNIKLYTSTEGGTFAWQEIGA